MSESIAFHQRNIAFDLADTIALEYVEIDATGKRAAIPVVLVVGVVIHSLAPTVEDRETRAQQAGRRRLCRPWKYL